MMGLVKKINMDSLWGRVQIPTGGIAREHDA